MKSHSIVRPLKVSGLLIWLTTLVAPTVARPQTTVESLEYDVGERARETIYASETIRIRNPGTQADLLAASRGSIPSLYGYRKAASREAAQALAKSWDDTRNSLLSSLAQTFGNRTFQTVETTSPAFQNAVDRFQAGNMDFPMTDALGRRWATGDEATDRLAGFTTHLENFMTTYFIRLDDEPGMAMENSTAVDMITLEEQEPGSLVEAAKLPQAQVARHQFIPETRAREMFMSQVRIPDRAVKSHVARFVRANTVFLESLSRKRWAETKGEIQNEVVFGEGSVIVQKGGEITPLIKEALEHMIIGLRYARLKDSVIIELARENPDAVQSASKVQNANKKASTQNNPKATPGSEASQPERPQGMLPPLLAPTTVARNDTGGATTASGTFVSNSLSTILSSTDSMYQWLMGLGIFTLIGLLFFSYFRKKQPVYIDGSMTPAVVDAQKESLVRELSSNLVQTLFRQRQTLIKSKESATAQVAAMENRLARLQPEIFDKLKAYEDKIKKLEKQLEHQHVSIESLDQPLVKDDGNPGESWDDENDGVQAENVTRPQFNDKTKETSKPLPNHKDAEASNHESHYDNKEVSFPGRNKAIHPDEETPAKPMEETLENLVVEDTFEKRVAKGSKP